MWSGLFSMSQARLLIVLLSFLVVQCLADDAVTNEEGLKFLEENKNKEGVITLESGLQYKVLNAGSGTAHPMMYSDCTCHYEGKLIDGTKFDSSYDRGKPSNFEPANVIDGWTEIMQKMVEGDKFELYIPADLGYGKRGSPPTIPGGSVLIFQMELIKVSGEQRPALRCKVVFSEDGSEIESLERCNEEETKYVEKVSSWDKDKVRQEQRRLVGMNSGNVKLEAVNWIQRRFHILKQVGKFAKPPALKEEL